MAAGLVAETGPDTPHGANERNILLGRRYKQITPATPIDTATFPHTETGKRSVRKC